MRLPARLVSFANSRAVTDLCRQLVPDGRPLAVSLRPVHEAEPNNCFEVVARQVRTAGGKASYGWKLAELPYVLIEAQFHAVWRRPDGQLLDITPGPSHGGYIVFVPDARRVYAGRQVKFVQRALTDHPAVEEYMRACDGEFEFMNRGTRAGQHGQFEFTGPEGAELAEITARKAEALRTLRQTTPVPSRNDPCPCGSGKKYKRCHGG